MSLLAFRLYDPAECGPDGYPPVWHQMLKHKVREDAGNRCVRCCHPYAKRGGEWSPCDERCAHRGPARLSYRADDGSTVERLEHDLATEAGVVVGYGKTVEAHWRILTVHHLNGKKHDCRWWNLVALCQRCHLHIQGKVQMERVYPWGHTEWFKPYVAGWYAFAYLGEELSRDQVEDRLDELLALERQVA